MNSSGNDSSYGADAQFQSYNQNYVTPMGQVGFRGPVPGSGMSTMPNMPNTPLQGIVAQGVARVSTPINPAQSQNQVPFLPEYDIQRIALALENLLTEKLNARIDERITPLVECIDRLSIENKELHMKLDELEMYSRKSCVRIFGVPESKTDCDSAVMEIAEEAPSATSSYRNRCMRGVSVNQELTKKRSKLAYEARQMVKAGVIKSTFIWDGKIFLVDKQEKKHLVTSLDKLIEVQNYLASAIQPGHPPVSNT
ncbi:hypothetical protein FSP39_013749 [Pinctada imbricata]|uniref:Uncharacterized protein n=1 Tax=Pinctada imbricata TaxID=66713 RepID=A0AA89C5U6_PINIB|nr:hypothetical protein FSP39_013749 [Pinctada imbricata]